MQSAASSTSSCRRNAETTSTQLDMIQHDRRTL
jgi:hypothetical protein